MIRCLSRPACILLVASFLGGCKVDLYSGLPEGEANRMLALLMLRHIDAEKKTLKGDTVTIRVEKAQFVNAVELLRQNGLPRKSAVTVQELFPSGQLVTSPAQEQAKIIFLKEQELGTMLRSMDGVIDAQVSIAESAGPNRYDPPTRSASVFVKYSPDRNLESRETDIRSLIMKGVPNLQADNITVVMQRADYRYLLASPSRPSGDAAAHAPAVRHRLWLVAPLFAVALALVATAAAMFALRRRRKRA
ncbi:MAG TPA: type III secretion inner membrane ring lipoprotein SctJ [Trinickia sp.]|jgi:type III secretion protein J|nr:type III secretion inner membrane ring lipoprotein SctJ [Trinickia sp.]